MCKLAFAEKAIRLSLMLVSGLFLGCADVEFKKGYDVGLASATSQCQEAKANLKIVAGTIVVGKDNGVCLLGTDNNVYCPPLPARKTITVK